MNKQKTNNHVEPVPRGTDAGLATIERRLAEIAATSEQQILALRDAIGEFVDSELTLRDKEIAILKRQSGREEFKALVEEMQRAFEAKLAAPEERIKAVPGKLPTNGSAAAVTPRDFRNSRRERKVCMRRAPR